MATLATKRRRDEDQDEQDLAGLGERKKPRQLPFRISPTTKHANLPSHVHRQFSPAFDPALAITPAESSSSDDDNAMSHDESLSSSPRNQRLRRSDLPSLALRIHPASDADSDLEMTDTQSASTNANMNLHSQWLAGAALNPIQNRVNSPIPPHLVTDSLNISGGRTGTPIHSHFTANMKPDAMIHGSTTPHNPSGEANRESAPFQADCETWWRRRRLPSPISEDEISPTTTIRLPGLDSQYLQPPPFNTELYRRPDERLSISLNRETQAQAQVQAPTHQIHQAQWTDNWGNEPEQIPTSTCVENNTLPGRGGRPKVTIAMGFRADCEKCQQRVPGHYSHIIRL